jgi:RNA-directed DNA polymerase
MDGKCFVETESGTPQGGVISPLLANIALHGMEDYVRNCLDIKTRSNQPHLIRYADDFIILHKEIEVIEKCKEAITQWLKPSKTRICHTLYEHSGEKAGFDFLGFKIRHYPCTKIRAMWVKGRNTGLTLTIKPSKEKVKAHLADLRKVIRTHKTAPQIALIETLNPIIRGWCNYYSTVVSKTTFSKCKGVLWHMLWAWAKYRHPNKSLHWIRERYWHTDIPIKRFVKVQGKRSPYDGDWVYWSQRLGKSPLISTRVATLLKKQGGKCAYCHKYFTPDDQIEVDHIQPKSRGGKDTLDNLQLLHKCCHDFKTAKDSSSAKVYTHDKGYPAEEPYEGKLSCTVLFRRWR